MGSMAGTLLSLWLYVNQECLLLEAKKLYGVLYGAAHHTNKQRGIIMWYGGQGEKYGIPTLRIPVTLGDSRKDLHGD